MLLMICVQNKLRQYIVGEIMVIHIGLQKKIVMLENLRFYPGEEQNDPKFAELIARQGDIYVNEAFAVCHREHASMVGVPHILPACAGFQLEKELKYLNLKNPDTPIVAILGGAELKTKIPVIKNLLPKVDKLLIGGAMVFTFFKAIGYDVGDSIVDETELANAKTLINLACF